MVRLIVLIGSASCLLCAAAGADDLERQHPQWALLMTEAREAWSAGDFERGNDKLLLAVELAQGFTSPMALARTLDRAGEQLIAADDPDGAVRLLEEARSIKEAADGPRSAGIADTLMIMARAVASRRDDERESHLQNALELSRDALDIRREAFGEGSCEMGEVEVYLGNLQEAVGDADEAERSYREVVAYCPPLHPQKTGDDVGMSAEAALLSLLWNQGRGAEGEAIIDSWPEVEATPPAEAAAAPEPGAEPPPDSP
jgi:tetratricopeptide (TPR) repeat protein